MSENYYLVCKDKKTLMPLFSMGLGGISLVDKRWVFDFILKCSGSEVKLLHGDADEVPDDEEQKSGWEFINAWHEYKETKDD